MIPSGARLPAIAGTVLIGPVAAGLFESGLCCPGPGHTGVWIVAGTGATGVIAGAGWIFAGDRAGGITALLTNAVVLSLYGFPAMFFLMGGAR